MGRSSRDAYDTLRAGANRGLAWSLTYSAKRYKLDLSR
jgi:hypothetical protein